ncbi:MAG: hypothetical protein ABI217_03975 [Chthoniobacterales bacterium]
MKQIVILLAATASLSACATQPTSPTDAKPVPAQRVFNQALATPAAGKTEVRFVRDVGFLGGGVKARLSLNGQPFAELGAGESFSIYLVPRIYTFSMIQRPNLFGYEVPREIEVEVKPGRTMKIRIGFSDNGPIFSPMTY